MSSYNSSKDSSGSDSDTDADSYVSDGDEDDDKSEDEEVEHEDEPLADVLKQIEESESQEASEVHIPSNLDVDEIQERKYKRNPVRVNNDHLVGNVSKEHLNLIAELKKQGIFESKEVEDIMSRVDFSWFYKEWGVDWPYTNVKMLQSTMKVLKKGIDILSFPLNIYYNVCLALMIGHEGSIICFGMSTVRIVKYFDWPMRLISC